MRGADLVVICTPIPEIVGAVAQVLALAPAAIVTDAGSIKAMVADAVAAAAAPEDLHRFVPGHPLGGSERSGPEHAAASVVDDIVWVLAPTEASDPAAVDRLSAWIVRIGARPVRLTPERHDRLVAFVSHLPQVASTSLMGLAATEEAGEPDLLLLAAGGFRDLTRLAASNPRLWSEILLANRDQIVAAIDLFVARLGTLREQIAGSEGAEVERTFETAKRARLRLAAKPTVRAGVAVLQLEIPDEPGALARITATLGAGDVNIEDLQIVHSPEGGRGTGPRHGRRPGGHRRGRGAPGLRPRPDPAGVRSRSMLARIQPGGTLRGTARVPGDKSIAHRWLILAATARGPSRMIDLPPSLDVRSTASSLARVALKARPALDIWTANAAAWVEPPGSTWNADIEASRYRVLELEGEGREGLHRSVEPLDCGNSGTSMRLLTGLLAAAPFASTLIGDASLSSRPMERVAGPLRGMGADIRTEDGHARSWSGAAGSSGVGTSWRWRPRR